MVEPRPERRTRTWSELNRQVDAVAAGFAAHGLVAGHRIGILGPNSIEFVVAYFAALRAGFVAVPINPLLSRTEIQQIVADSGLRVLLTATDQRFEGVHHVSLTADGLAALAAPGATPTSSPKDREALAVLLYTAGTSGEPKAAMLTHRALLGHLAQVAQFGVVELRDRRAGDAAAVPRLRSQCRAGWLGAGGSAVGDHGRDGRLLRGRWRPSR